MPEAISLAKLNLLGLRSANGQGHRLGHERSGLRKDRKVALLTIGNLARSTNCGVGQDTHVVGNG